MFLDFPAGMQSLVNSFSFMPLNFFRCNEKCPFGNISYIPVKITKTVDIEEIIALLVDRNNSFFLGEHKIY